MKLKFDKESKSVGIEFGEYRGIWVNLMNEWPQLWQKCNWKTFNVINIYFEDDIMMGGFEFEFWLLGFGIRLRVNYTQTEQVRELLEKAKEIESGEAKTIPWERLESEETNGRMGQRMFNFLCWLKDEKGINSEQSGRMGDPFNLSDEKFFKYYDEYSKDI